MSGNKNYKVEYLSSVVKEDIPALPKTWRAKIRSAILNKLTTHPEVFGKPLRRSLKGFRRLRVGDYRVIYLIEKDVVLVVVIKHRSVVYKKWKD